MRNQAYVRNSDRGSHFRLDRVGGRLTARRRRSITESMKVFDVSLSKDIATVDLDEVNWLASTSRDESVFGANTATRDERSPHDAAGNESQVRTILSICMPAESSGLHGSLNVHDKYARHRVALAKTYHGNIRDTATDGNGKELPGTSTYERSRVTFVWGGLQMFRDAANDRLLGCDWLFHQKTREHCGGSLVEPLFEKGINFLF
jgi:hypothetical protein